MSRFVIRHENASALASVLHRARKSARVDPRLFKKVFDGERLNAKTILERLFPVVQEAEWPSENRPAYVDDEESFLEEFFRSELALRAPSLSGVHREFSASKSSSTLLTNAAYTDLCVSNTQIRSALHVLTKAAEAELTYTPYLAGILAIVARGGYAGYVLADEPMRDRFERTWKPDVVKPGLRATIEGLKPWDDDSDEADIELEVAESLRRIVSLPIQRKRKTFKHNHIFFLWQGTNRVEGIRPIKRSDNQSSGTMFSVVMSGNEADSGFRVRRESILAAIAAHIERFKDPSSASGAHPDLITLWLDWLSETGMLDDNQFDLLSREVTDCLSSLSLEEVHELKMRSMRTDHISHVAR